MKTFLLLLAAVTLAGCGSSSVFDQRYVPDRAEFGSGKINVPPPPSTLPHVDVVNDDPTGTPTVIEQISGTWTFVTPSTVTRVERKTSTFSQYSLYNGRPEATDTPFAVITVSSDATGTAESDPENYKVANTRVYALNGNVAQEWTGNTKAGRGFCELVIKKPGTPPNKPGDSCHVMAIVKSADEQKLALSILASIKYTPNTETQPAQPQQSSGNEQPPTSITYFSKSEPITEKGSDGHYHTIRLMTEYRWELGNDGNYVSANYHKRADGPWIREN